MFLYVYIGFFAKSLFLIYFIYSNKTDNFSKYSMMAFEYILHIIYFGFIVYSFYSFKNIPHACVFSNTYAVIICFVIISLGVFKILLYGFKFLLICLTFPILVYYFIKNPSEFFRRVGVDPEIIENWPTISASLEQEIDCVICTENIKEGQQILILNCTGK